MTFLKITTLPETWVNTDHVVCWKEQVSGPGLRTHLRLTEYEIVLHGMSATEVAERLGAHDTPEDLDDITEDEHD